MSGEIIPVREGNAASSTKDIKHSYEYLSTELLDLFNSQTFLSPKVATVNLIGGDSHTKQFLSSEKGHKYLKLSNPTLKSVKPLLDTTKEPSVLLLRGCGMLLQSVDFPVDKFKSLTALEISRCRRLTTLPENTICQMTNLQSLDLSYLQIDQLPDGLFTNIANSLRSLVLKGCSNLLVLPKPPQTLDMLEYLDLSHLPIKTVPAEFISLQLRSLILRGCSKLHSIPFGSLTSKLQSLDLSHCTSLPTKMEPITDTVQVLDLSYTALCWEHVPESVSHLFFKNANLCIPWTRRVQSMKMIKVCDLSGSKDLKDTSVLREFLALEALDLSRTGLEYMEISDSLIILLLRECRRLKNFLILQSANLEVLDLSGCELLGDLPNNLCLQRRLKKLNLCGCKGLRELREDHFNRMSSLENLDLSNIDISNFASFANLIDRGIMINHSHASVMPTEMSHLMNPDSDNSGTYCEFHLVSTFICSSGFDKFRYELTGLKDNISFLEKKSTVKSERICADLEYILDKLDLLESSQNCRTSEGLLHELMNYDYDNLDDHSYILKKLFRTVAKLKALVPPPPPPPPHPLPPEILIKDEHKKMLKSRSRMELYNSFNRHAIQMDGESFVGDYELLTPIQRNCLLYLACLPVPIRVDVPIKESILIHLWYGEGFFEVDNSNRTIEEVGQETLQFLEAMGFIEFQRERKVYMKADVHSFLVIKAMEEQSFDFNNDGKLTPEFAVARRACLLKADVNHKRSSQMWLNYTKSPEKLESFKTVHTLLYIDEPVVDIKTEWFSAMTNLRVLHLVNLYSDPVNIVDLKFLEELKRMKQLRLLNLESFAVINKLPDSICELTNLGILNLSYCSNLVELPAGIASLTNLIILDLTQCHLLSELPKGLALLSKLEVIKGFAITYEVSGRQSKKACTLRELLKLKSLRKLNLVVNRDSFPDARDLQVLRNMNELRNLKITWKRNNYREQELADTVGNGALRQFRWKQLRCWGLYNETEEVEDELLLTNNCLENLNKLVLCCFPLRVAPDWLNPRELRKLERLYIVGGSLKRLFVGYTEQTTWSIKALKLKYLSNLDMDWITLRGNFPNMYSYDGHGSPHI